ncbi:SusC/RagA family TonB-linked outer membrane protein [Parabacteroides goldsteinii]|nr:TonB-dependent receptor [Parabacteroides goldsteinii]TFU73174.1 TonB-dependent receptor [Parabacteroides sp. P14]MBS6575131.1 TonB-dependent receptor [Parabacteroides goldsteinii]MRX97913.1 SusC/RagA family TonB-linked outer membrane protein [Parabacteroides goldsteinii]MRY01906.1 SusC/RagA family TonB-linked outer membrane protein [Parabacteroides goldsteinii]
MATAQTTKVTGTVISADDNEPIIGASIVVKGTMVGTVTDFDGAFSLDVPSSAKTLVVSYVGMKTQEIEVKSNLRILMQTDNQSLDEVVVVAYGTAKKESFTGSAEIIKNEKIEKRTVANVSKALDGLVAGVQTTSGSGQPGSGSSVVIRGFGSIKASQNPLYVVDGIPYDGNINAINPNDIESMTVLKDASAGALYGSRGANGVVMITTKKGKDGALLVNLKANWGIASRAIPRYETMDERGYLETIFQSYKNDQIASNGLSPEAASVAALTAMGSGAKAIFGTNQMYNPFNFPIAELIDPVTGKVRSDATLRYHEDWMDEATANNPLRQEYVLNMSGSQNKTKYMFSLGYLNEDGLLKTTNFQRYTGRINVDTEYKNWLTAGLSTNFAHTKSNTSQTSTSASSNIFYSAQLMAPIFPVHQLDENGQIMYGADGAPMFDYGSTRPAGANANFNSIATLFDDKYGTNDDNVSGRTYISLGDLKDGPLQGLKLTANFGFDYVNRNNFTYYNPYFGNAASVKGMLAKSNYRYFSYTFNQLLTYDRKFNDKHHIDFLAGHEYYDYEVSSLSATKSGFPFGGIYELAGATTITDASSLKDSYTIESYLFRANYDYMDKYYLSASFRTDGSSRFNKDYRWGKFWSVGANWRMNNEAFLSDVDWLNNLSVKASYGVQGNDNVGTLYAWQSFYDLGWPNASMSGALVSSLENTNLKWEQNGNLNVGVEAKVFDRFSASIEWYNRKTTDMLLDYPMASSLGFDSYLKNIGSMRNTGWDITLNGRLVNTNDFTWDLTLMGSTIKNKVLHLADKPEIISGNYIIKEGETINSFYTAKSAGVDPATGSQLYWVWDTDENGNPGEPYISSNINKATASKQIMGSRIPNLYGSFTNDFKYKGFDLSIMCTYSIGGKVLDSVYNTFMYGNYVGQAKHKNLERAWKQPGDITDVPKIEIGKAYPITDADLINASYLAIKNITLGYSLPTRLTKGMFMKEIRFTATADNLVLFSHLKGMDPQYNFSGGTTFVYTPSRTISFGVDVKF